MIDDIIAKWYDKDSRVHLDLELKVGMLQGKPIYTILWGNQWMMHFNIIKEIESLARIKGYEIFLSSEGVELRPKND